MSGRARLRLHLSPAAETAVRHGHPWIYPDRIRQQNRPGVTGEIAALYDRQDRFLGLGLFDSASPLRVRVLHVGSPRCVDDAWWTARLEAGLERRAGLFDAATTGWRCLHGESDGWPGLVLDRYGDVFVLKLYTAAWLPRLAEIHRVVQRRLHPRALVLRLSRNVAALAGQEFDRRDGEVLAGEPIAGPVTFLESGIRFEADVLRGQKTGFFLDQRENRRQVGAHCSGADVLNAFSFSGGFSLHAAHGGARSVTDLDLSAHALESARRNFALNSDLPGVAAARHACVQAEAFEWLAAESRPNFDVVILDPPSLARRETERPGAVSAYAKLAALGAGRVRAGGMMLAASCSAHVPSDAFFHAIRQGARRSGRRFVEWCTTGHPPDHAATFPEGHYLKAIYLRFP